MRLVLPLLLAVPAVLVPAAPALACSCAGPLTDGAAVERADVVLAGQVLERREPPVLGELVSTADRAVYVVEVARVHKGTAPPVVEVGTASSGASCGVDLPVGRPALLFAQEDEAGRLSVGLCDGSRPAPVEDAALALGPGQPPDAAVPAVPAVPGQRAVLVATGLLAAAALALLGAVSRAGPARAARR